MVWNPFKIIPKKILGIDIGTSTIRIVELSRQGQRKKLENYGEITIGSACEKPFRSFEKSDFLLSSQDVSQVILAIIREAKIQTRKAIFSLPDFSTFYTNFELPPMPKEELSKAIQFEARQHIPLLIEEVILDWQVIERKDFSNSRKTELKILLLAIPHETVNQYREISKLCQLELVALEAEAFGLVRSLIKEDDKKKTILLLEIGDRSTTCSIVDNGVLNISHSFDMSGSKLTEAISRGMSIDHKAAEDLKKEYGLKESEKEKNVAKILFPLIDSILNDIEKITQNFYRTEKKEVEKIIVAGGSARLPGLKNYFEQILKKEIEIANPFADIFYPPILEKSLKEMGPSHSIVVGTALRGLEI